ncbi:hypothetical protein BD410DRAFT_833187 [Rickenella mellea]|uniref:Uncharacterized protein n=1 Tax=Rickenella mellea TaxID=50990 RepID=A0A4Y7PHK6_9AGAM|nr:hypothetical protein BD410DRAFT_833187 [Rickenella mellea]
MSNFNAASIIEPVIAALNIAGTKDWRIEHHSQINAERSRVDHAIVAVPLYQPAGADVFTTPHFKAVPKYNPNDPDTFWKLLEVSKFNELDMNKKYPIVLCAFEDKKSRTLHYREWERNLIDLQDAESRGEQVRPLRVCGDEVNAIGCQAMKYIERYKTDTVFLFDGDTFIQFTASNYQFVAKRFEGRIAVYLNNIPRENIRRAVAAICFKKMSVIMDFNSPRGWVSNYS